MIAIIIWIPYYFSMNKYQHKDWLSFRGEVIRLDSYACTKCGRRESDGPVLQVHHKQYIQGHKPWEYGYDMCETICKGCHASIHGIIPPKTGWEYAGYDDLGNLSGVCDCCGKSIRHSFLIHHEKWHPMEVGTVCCDNLTSTEVASEQKKLQLSNNEKRKRFLDSNRWFIDYKGHHQIKKEHFRIEISKTDIGFLLRINDRQGKGLYTSLTDAKIRAFDVIESGEFTKYCRDKYLKKPKLSRVGRKSPTHTCLTPTPLPPNYH